MALELNRFYVYVLLDPRKSWNADTDFLGLHYQPFYIGKGSGNRYRRHLQETSHNRYRDRVVKAIKNAEYDFKNYIKIVVNELSEDQAFTLERILIKYYGRRNDGGILTNVSLGGVGTPGFPSPYKGMKIEEIIGLERGAEFRRKMREYALNRTYSNLGKSMPTKGKTYEEIFGIQVAAKEKKIRSDLRKGKSAAELYGELRAKEIFKKVAEKQSGHLSTQAKKYKITSPQGEIYMICGMREFCRQHKLSHSIMFRIANRSYTYRYKGWKCEHYVSEGYEHD